MDSVPAFNDDPVYNTSVGFEEWCVSVSNRIEEAHTDENVSIYPYQAERIVKNLLSFEAGQQVFNQLDRTIETINVEEVQIGVLYGLVEETIVIESYLIDGSNEQSIFNVQQLPSGFVRFIIAHNTQNPLVRVEVVDEFNAHQYLFHSLKSLLIISLNNYSNE